MKKYEIELGCFGYYGFANGYEGVENPEIRGSGNAGYCSRCCPRMQACWDRMKQRLDDTFPELAAGGGEAYLLCSASHIEDGFRVASGAKPMDRGKMTLTWPLENLETEH